MSDSSSDGDFESFVPPAALSIHDVQSSILTRASIRHVNRWFKALIATYHAADALFVTPRNVLTLQRQVDFSKTSTKSDHDFLVLSSVRHLIVEVGDEGTHFLGVSYSELLVSIAVHISNLLSVTTVRPGNASSLRTPPSTIHISGSERFPRTVCKLDIDGSLWCRPFFHVFRKAATDLETLIVRDDAHLLQRPYPANLSVEGPIVFHPDDPIYPALRQLHLYLIPPTVHLWLEFAAQGASSLTHLCMIINYHVVDEDFFPEEMFPRLTHFALRCAPTVMINVLRRPFPPNVAHLTLSILEIKDNPAAYATAATELFIALKTMLQAHANKIRTLWFTENAVLDVVRGRIRTEVDGVLSLRSGRLVEEKCTIDNKPGWCFQHRRNISG
ncbi:hypothetical protein OF83DRAFT_1175127 [Amylostereum chailletii]|nr:hypothetical protein OF83DRAFT_1175127 [Amylostereum chailletii]